MISQIEPWIDEGELLELKRVIKSTFVVEHELTSEFEQMTKELTGSKHAIAYSNGTMALYASLIALGVEPGDEIIIPNITFVATANAVIMAGATPVLCEVNETTFTIDINKAGKLLSERTRIIIPVHLYGQSVNMDEVTNFAKENGLKVLEDAAQGVGVRFNGKHAGTFGEIGVLSYYGNKTITCGEGGVILTENDELANKVYRLKNHGRDVKGTFIHDTIGYNFSFTEMQAAVGIAQMKKLSRIIQRKKEINEIYLKELGGMTQLKAVQIDERTTPVFWFTSFLCEDAKNIESFLKVHEIQSRRFFFPLHLQPCYQNKKYIKNINDDFKISEHLYHTGISLPSSYMLTPSDQNIVIEKIKEYYEHRN